MTFSEKSAAELAATSFETELQQAVRLHNSQDINGARRLYEKLFAEQPARTDLKANLGIALLQQGFLQRGVELVQSALSEQPNHPQLAGAAKTVGSLLMQHQYWEVAYSWLLEAVQKNPDDAETAHMLARIYARDYLKPEIYDPLAQQTLKRYSPREAATYIYTIDIVGTCNLRCPTCPVGNSQDELRSKSLMSAAMFDAILEKIHRETITERPIIRLYSWGEPLLHPQLPAMVKRIREYGFSSQLSTNLNIEKGLKELIKANPDEIKISLSGFTQATYNETHHKGNLLLVKSNLYKLRKYMDQYQATTNVWIGHHLYKNNLDHQADVRKICAELNFGYQPVQAFYQPLEKLIKLVEGDSTTAAEPILNQLIVHPLAQIQFSKQHQQLDYDCELRFNQTVINTDGSVAQCCCHYETRHALGIQFLAVPQTTIEEKKYQNPLCVTCRKHGLDYAPRSLPESLSAS